MLAAKASAPGKASAAAALRASAVRRRGDSASSYNFIATASPGSQLKALPAP